MSISEQTSKSELAKEENTCNAGEGNAPPEASPPQSPDVQAPSAPSKSIGGNKRRKFRLILMPFRILRKRYTTFMDTKSDKEDEDDT
ncbi:uncharacterized protein ARMOST_18212 [Armillaria ostoyae]|uniref:Uncharacterized protein n=1 Tax=Armillaria ostoyae TaxID=47428 RepID=A0A284S170_ARMOS|nr:uncharacterized protein ARMOST_18212 [Armillaria ostoyae]